MRLMADRASVQLGDPLIARARPSSLADLLLMIERADAEVVVIDEFTYWVRASPRALSELQEFVDNYLKGSNLLLLVAGSLVGVMERTVLSGGFPSTLELEGGFA